MKNTLITFVLATLCIVVVNTTANAALPAPASAEKSLNHIVAVVNTDIITQTELTQAMKRAQQQIKKSGMAAPDAQTLQDEVLKQLIYAKLELQVAKKYNLKITDTQIDQAIQHIVKHNHTTLASLKQKLKSKGYTMAKFRNDVKDQLLVAQVQQQAVAGMITINDQDVKNYQDSYKQKQQGNVQYHVLDILIPASPNAKQQALVVLDNLNKGKSAQAAAGKLAQVNDMGWQSGAALPELFVNTLTPMRVGTVSAPLKAGNGYHILKLLNKRGRANTKLPTLEQAQRAIFQQKFGPTLMKWLAKLRKDAYVKIMPTE